MDKDEKFFENRILELAERSYNKGIYTYSDFLNLHEQNIFHTMISKLPPIDYSLVGGNIYAERKMIEFKPSEIYYDSIPPIAVLRVEPLNNKFSDTLTHRDFLGAILNLGIDRSKTGDIIINDNVAYIYVLDSMTNFLMEHLMRVKHTTVKCSIHQSENFSMVPEFKEIVSTVNNIRLDAVISAAFGISRNKCIMYISEGKVFVNGKLITSNGYGLKEKDIVSVRGLGRCIFEEHLGVTKKGRNLIKLLKYI